MILVGSGTGVAGLRAHLKARISAGVRRNWLHFGERSAQYDFFHGQDILQRQAQGFIERRDLAFSRNQPGASMYNTSRRPASVHFLNGWKRVLPSVSAAAWQAWLWRGRRASRSPGRGRNRKHAGRRALPT